MCLLPFYSDSVFIVTYNKARLLCNSRSCCLYFGWMAKSHDSSAQDVITISVHRKLNFGSHGRRNSRRWGEKKGCFSIFFIILDCLFFSSVASLTTGNQFLFQCEWKNVCHACSICVRVLKSIWCHTTVRLTCQTVAPSFNILKQAGVSRSVTQPCSYSYCTKCASVRVVLLFRWIAHFKRMCKTEDMDSIVTCVSPWLKQERTRTRKSYDATA